MNSTKHTPGPWELVFHSYGYEIKEAHKQHSCTTFTTVTTLRPQGGRELQYAHLIAAAPAMYEALKAITSEINLGKLNVRKDFSLLNAHACATKALAQAEGR